METTRDRLKKFIAYKKLSIRKFEQSIDVSNGYINNIRESIGADMLLKITNAYPDLNPSWLIVGDGDMLNANDTGSVQFYEPENIPSGKKLIPFYEDVSTIGGNLPGYSANMESGGHPTEWIDPGDWFKNATAAIRHHGDSMTEYPPGCIFALKEVFDKSLLIWGMDYVIETSEYRITKRVQRGQKDGYILACSTNQETYIDGRLMHEPIDIFVDAAKFYMVLGYVIKKNGGTIVYDSQMNRK